MRYLALVVSLTVFSSNLVCSQTLSHRPEGHAGEQTSIPANVPITIPLRVPAGTPIKVVLDREVRLKHEGQAIHGKVAEPVYAFDKLLVPVGSEVAGRVTAIESLSKKKRTLAALDADFSPARQVQIEFDQLQLADGRRIPLKTTVTQGSQGVLQLVPADDKEGKKGIKERGEKAAKGKLSDKKQEIKHDWEMAKEQIHQPGKMHRLERMGLAELPYRPQYIDAGTAFDADLQTAVDFGSETLPPEGLLAIGSPPPPGSCVHAVLMTPLSSASSKKGEPVEAVITQPLFVSGRLVLPEGSKVKGTVLEVRAARRLERNGLLRVVFHEIVPPDGVEQKVESSLEAVSVAKGEHLTLDAEGGAQVTTPKTRYLTTGIAVALASTSMNQEHEHGGPAETDPSKGAANGASGFRVIGTALGALVHSRVLTSGLGFYGAGMSVYSHFLARGRDVVYPKDMSMIIGLGTPAPRPSTDIQPH